MPLTIGVLAPSGAVDGAKLATGVAALEALGRRVVVHPQAHARAGPFAGTPQDKVAALMALARDPTIDAIWAARGGSGATAALPLLPPGPLGKPLVGYSDVTAWLAVLGGVHGPMLQGARADDLAATLDILSGGPWALEGAALRPGRAAGPVIGGNMATFCALLGTPHMPEVSGSILALEDWREAPHRLDRAFTHLRNAGVLGAIAGLALGDILTEDAHEPFGADARAIVESQVADLPIPVAWGLPFGHGARNRPFALGGWAVLEDGTLRGA
jgi:muramoyltetrapeptide carboxypeptidase